MTHLERAERGPKYAQHAAHPEPTDADRDSLDDWIVSELGDEPEAGDDNAGGRVQVRWEPGVGFVKRS